MKIRILEISNFKNIGVSELDRESNEKLNSQKLYLNANYSEDAMGGLVLLVGENNTGKSNIIKALKEFSYEDTLKAANDTPNFIGYEDCEPPAPRGGGPQTPITQNL